MLNAAFSTAISCRFLSNHARVNMKTATVLIFAAIVLSGVEDAFGCNCDLPLRNLSIKQQVKQALKHSEAVFSGRVLDISASPDDHYLVVRLKVEKSWKSSRAEEILLLQVVVQAIVVFTLL
jgi:hypothetical protein